MIYKVTVYIPDEKRHSPYVVKGLIELEKMGYISLNFRSISFSVHNRVTFENDKFREQKKSYPWCIELDVFNTKSKRKVRIGIDLQDWEGLFSKHSINHCDIVYKRAVNKEGLKKLNKLKPDFFKRFGPNYNVRLKDTRFSFFYKLSSFKSNFKKVFITPKKVLHKLYSIFHSENDIKINSSNKIVYSIQKPPNYDYIFFQVKYYDWDNKFSKSVNDSRKNIITCLKKNFGEKFIGGMYYKKPLPIDFQQCQTNVEPDFNNYKNFVKNASIVISSNGFGNSIPWKLIEYMKWGCCIVSEKNKHSFRISPKLGVLEFFENENELIKKCRMLLGKKKIIDDYKSKSKDYFSNNLNPKAVMKSIIENS